MNNRPYWTDRIIAIFTGLILLTYVTSDYFLWRQLQSTEKTLKHSGESFQKTLGEMKSQTKAQQDAANAAEGQLAQAQRALGATIDSFRLEQRAWVGKSEASGSGFTVGSKAAITIRLTNSGRTPAEKLRTLVDGGSIKKGESFKIFYPESANAAFVSPPGKAIFSEGTIQPQSSQTISVPMNPTITQRHLDVIRDGSFIVYGFGKITYDDIFGHHHLTTFCVFLQPDLSTVADCDIYNYAD